MTRKKKVLTENELLIKRAKENNDLIREKPRNPRKKLKLTLPLCPSVNHCYRYVKGRKFMTKEALQFMQVTNQIVEREKIKQKYTIEKKGVWMVVEVNYFFPDRLRRDGHNMHKILADALNGCAYVDDQFILIRDMSIELDKENPRLEITIYPLKRGKENGNKTK